MKTTQAAAIHFKCCSPYGFYNLVTDSLRYWVETMGVDGFRFDLATILGRQDATLSILNSAFFHRIKTRSNISAN